MKIKYGWVMVAIGAFMTCIAIGAMFCSQYSCSRSLRRRAGRTRRYRAP